MDPIKVYKRILLLVFGGMYATLVWALCEPSLGNDAGQYFLYAQNLWREGVYGLELGVWDAHREPGYSVYLALIGAPFFAWAGDDRTFATLIFAQAFFFSVACLFFFFRAENMPLRLRKILLFLLLASPTVFSAHGMLYSESLSLTLSVLLLGLLGGKDLSKKSFFWIFICVFLAAFTKNYWARIWLFLPFGLFFLRRPQTRRIVLAIGGASFTAFLLWKAYSSALDDGGGAQTREYMNLAGKIRRAVKVDYVTEWRPALASVLGANFCERKYGIEECLKHDFRGSDREGIAFLKEISANRGSPGVLLVKEWLASAPKQVVASLLEFIRMSFFEFTDIGRFSTVGFVKYFAPAWHFFGSLLMLFAIGIGLRRLNLAELWVGVPLFFIAFHVLVYVNVSVVSRFILPVLPFLYLFASGGIWSCMERFSPRKRERSPSFSQNNALHL